MRSSSASTATVFALLSCCALFLGCTSVSHLRPSPRATEIDVTTPGEPAKYTVEIKPLSSQFTAKVDRLPAFVVSITNHAQSPLLVSTANVTAFSNNRAVRVYDPTEVAKLARNDAEMRVFLANAQGAARIQTAQYSQFISGGSAVVPVRTKALTDLAAARKDALAELTRATSLLFPYSLPPAATVTGVVELHAEDIAPDQPLTITFTAGTEKHTFYFDVQS